MGRRSTSRSFAAMLRRIWERTDGKCHLCHVRVRLSSYGARGESDEWEVDHSNARARGGTTTDTTSTLLMPLATARSRIAQRVLSAVRTVKRALRSPETRRMRSAKATPPPEHFSVRHSALSSVVLRARCSLGRSALLRATTRGWSRNAVMLAAPRDRRSPEVRGGRHGGRGARQSTPMPLDGPRRTGRRRGVPRARCGRNVRTQSADVAPIRRRAPARRPAQLQPRTRRMVSSPPVGELPRIC